MFHAIEITLTLTELRYASDTTGTRKTADLCRGEFGQGAEEAQRWKLIHPEAVGLITAAILEGIRDGRLVSNLMSHGATLLKRKDVMPGVAEMIPELQVEGTFPDGTKLVTVHEPIR